MRPCECHNEWFHDQECPAYVWAEWGYAISPDEDVMVGPSPEGGPDGD